MHIFLFLLKFTVLDEYEDVSKLDENKMTNQVLHLDIAISFFLYEFEIISVLNLHEQVVKQQTTFCQTER